MIRGLRALPGRSHALPSSPDRLRVIHVVAGSGIGGIETTLSRLLPRLGEAGIEAQVLLLRPHEGLEAFLEAAGVPCRSLPGGPPLRVLRELRRHLIDARPHIVHLYGSRATYLGRPAARFCRGARIVTGLINTDPPRGLVPRLLDLATAPLGDLFVANSLASAAAHGLRDSGAKRWRIVYEGIPVGEDDGPDLDRARRIRERLDLGQDPVILVVANLKPVKGHLDLVLAAPEILRRHPRARFVLAGEDRMGGAVQRWVRDLSLEAHFHFCGFQEDVASFHAAADVLVLPSRSEGVPVSIMEAMARGLPVVATQVGGVPELVGHGREGLLVPVMDPPALAAAISMVLSDPHLARSMGQAGRRRVRERFSIERMAREYSILYHELAGLRRREPSPREADLRAA